ncbi:hypothetical protein QA645_06665 [Bradyrhizobium sp. CIAT3101]|nr:hypothetical protein [Bradyrhizobium sp. CIAT3101]WFU82422.1 hypothetical protein QA645_06665 [Bradyrhizobium sp. CIAT3101]
MKHILTVVTFIMGALCFAMFLTTLKPDPLGALPRPDEPDKVIERAVP